ncbi:MAG: hypothetical protein ABIU07_07515 [Ramlibacter sp.]
MALVTGSGAEAAPGNAATAASDGNTGADAGIKGTGAVTACGALAAASTERALCAHPEFASPRHKPNNSVKRILPARMMFLLLPIRL